MGTKRYRSARGILGGDVVQWWLWVAGCAMSALIGLVLGWGTPGLGTDALRWIEDHNGLAGWLQALGATIAIAVTYFLASDGARRAQEEAERQRVSRKRAVLQSARVICTNLDNAAERYADRVRFLTGTQLVEQATEAYREFARLDLQMGSLPLHDLDGKKALDAFYSARIHTASAMETYSGFMAPYYRTEAMGDAAYEAFKAYKMRYVEAYIAFETEENKLPKA